MDITTIKQLNQMNMEFYQTVANSFDQTRQQPWEGWNQLVTEISQTGVPPQQIIDLGCGNARLAQFLVKHWPELRYVGLDNNQHLLEQARGTLGNLNVEFQVHELDLVSALLDQSLRKKLTQLLSHDRQPVLWSMFGVLHHIPSLRLRQQLVTTISEQMNADDFLAISCWQFNVSPNLWQRRTDPSQLKLSKLEENDFILDWQREKQAFRYCHLTTAAEVQTITDQANLSISATWAADGSSQNLNQYYLLGKKA